MIDVGKNIRNGEELPIEVIDDWLKEQVADLQGSPDVTQFLGGASNWTYRLKYDNYDLILRRPPIGTKAASAHDMQREFSIQKALSTHYPVPEMIAYCNDKSVVDFEFYVMKRIEGIIPRSNLPKGLELSKEDTRKLCINVLDNLIKLHLVDIEKTGLSSLGKGKGYAQRQITGWCERYKKTVTWNVPGFKKVMDWLQKNLPPIERSCLIHNDYRFDNVILDPDNPFKIIGVLDWEMATIGDPLMDLGNSLAYWVQADDDFISRLNRRQPTHLPGMLTREEVVEYYCQQMGFKDVDFRFYETYGLFRLAVIAQQIYYRYYHNQTKNKAFKNFWFLVNYLNWRCIKVINRKA
jgi:aminoglycoside phosphotransferase (APT) family kinase protein